MKRLRKRIVCLLCSMAVFMSAFYINASAEARTMHINFIVDDTYLYKNGLSNGTGGYLTYHFYIVSSVYRYAAGIYLVKEPFVYSGDTIISTHITDCPNIGGSGNYANRCWCTTDNGCSNTSGYHHTNAQYFIDHSMEISCINIKMNVHLVGSRLCIKDSGQHKNIYGLNEPNYKSALVQDAEITNGDGETYSIFDEVLVHEIGHFYNVEDHYNQINNHPNCVWGRYCQMEYVATHLPICSNCQKTLKDNRYLYNQ